jgi:hypothetical protein
VRDPLVERWVARDVGREEDLPGRELAGAFLLDGVVAVVIAYDADEGARAMLVVRRDATWRSEWTGPIGSCATSPPGR